MADCPTLLTCPFFIGKMKNMPSITTYLERHFCRGDYSYCARFIVSEGLGMQAVPEDLFPYEPRRAYELISKVGKP